MSPFLNNIEPFHVHGIQIRTKNVNEFDPSTAQIPTLWKRFPREVLETISPANKFVNSEPFGVYFSYESDANGSYDVIVGVNVNNTSSYGLGSIQVLGGAYLVFNAHGEMPKALIECWDNIWTFFSDPSCICKRAYLTDFEQYIASDFVLVNIGIQSIE
jgi:predicted transcriptional regulator YdeE